MNEPASALKTRGILNELHEERERQTKRFGVQRHHNGTGLASARYEAANSRHLCDVAFKNGWGTWRHILQEEVDEAFAEVVSGPLRAELVQVAAVCVAWIEAIDEHVESVTGKAKP